MHSLRDFLFGPCLACIARDSNIAFLKEQLRIRDIQVEHLEERLDKKADEQFEVIKQITGINRIARPEGDNKLVSMPRHQGIQDRIRRAEKIDAEQAIPIKAERQKEYQERLAALERPEIEVQDNAVG